MTMARERDSHIFERDPNNFYVEPDWCDMRLFATENFFPGIWDCACGTGRIVRAAKWAGLASIGTDIVNRGNTELDFLKATQANVVFPHIVSNPPYNLTRQFVEHALTLATGKVAFLLPIGWLISNRRSRWLQDTPLARVLVLSPRPSIPPWSYLQAGGKPEGGRTDYAWFIWQREHQGEPTVGWIRRAA